MRTEGSRAAGGLQTVGRDITAGLRPRTKVWLERDGRFVIGDGGLRLLLAIERRGSLSAAAAEIGWSYRHAWGYLRQAQRVLGARLTAARPGKGASRGTTLTDTGRRLAEQLGAVRGQLDVLLGPTGPTSEDVAARGQPKRGARRERS